MWLFLFLALCMATSFYISTFLVGFFSPLLMVGIRGIVSGILIFIIEYPTTKKLESELIKHKKHYLIAIIFGFLIPLVIQSFILSKMPPVDMSIISSTEPILIYTLAYLFFEEKLAKKQLFYLFAGSLIAFIAIILEADAERVSLISWQEPILLLITTFIGIGWLVISRLVHKHKQPEGTIIALGFISTGITAIALSLKLEEVFFSFEFAPMILFIVMVILGDLITTRMRIKLSKIYTQTMLALINIFSPFIIAIHESIFHSRHYSPIFFLLLIPSMICFIVFYFVECERQLVKNQPLPKN